MNKKNNKSIWKRWWVWAISIVLLIAVIGSGGEKSKVQLPEYKVVSVDNANIDSIIRETLNIVVYGEYVLDDLYAIAEKEAKEYTEENKVNALSIGFYEDESKIGTGYEMGYVDYVPNGNWSDAMKIKAGDYSDFEFVNELHEIIK